MSTVSPQQHQELGWLLDNLIAEVPDIRTVVLVSSDGLPKCASGLDPHDAERRGALVSGMFSLARGAGTGTVRQVVVELDDGTTFIVAAGHGSILAASAGPDADAAVVGYALDRLVRKVSAHLSTPARRAGAIDESAR